MTIQPKVTYRYSRLTFHRDSIEPLKSDDVFRVETRDGVFEMSKADFYQTFPNVVRSSAYKDNGYYNYEPVPEKAKRFLVKEQPGTIKKQLPRGQYALPTVLRGVCEETIYKKWLHRKAVAHVIRDRRRWPFTGSVADYKKAIHEAVLRAGKHDSYTGEELDWKLISKYDNKKSKSGGISYKKTFSRLPTVDHADDIPSDLNFRICFWRTNDAKSDLTLDEFVELCTKVVKHNRRSASHRPTRSPENPAPGEPCVSTK